MMDRLKKILLIAIMLIAGVSGFQSITLGAEYFGYDEVEFDLDLQAYAAYWAAPEIRMQLDSKTIEKFKTIKGISEGADMQVYCGHASSCQDVNFIGKLVDHRINGPKPADRDERGESFNQVSGNASAQPSEGPQTRELQQNIYDFSCEGNPIVTFDVSQTYTKKRDPIAWMMVEDRLLSRKNSNIKWMSDPQWREVDDNGFILPKGTSDQNNKRVSNHTGDEGSSEISWSSRAGVQGLKEWLAQFGSVRRGLWAQDDIKYGYYLDGMWITFDTDDYIYHPQLKKLYWIKALEYIHAIPLKHIFEWTYPGGLVECTLRKNGKIVQPNTDLQRPTQQSGSDQSNADKHGSLDKEKLMQALGESRVKILDGILRLLAQKTQDEQQQIYVLIKSFIDSKDTNTQNIGKYLMLKSTTQ